MIRWLAQAAVDGILALSGDRGPQVLLSFLFAMMVVTIHLTLCILRDLIFRTLFRFERPRPCPTPAS